MKLVEQCFLNRLSDIIRGTYVRSVNNTVCIFKHKWYESSKQIRTEEVASKHALYVSMHNFSENTKVCSLTRVI